MKYTCFDTVLSKHPTLEWGIHVNPWLIHVNVWQKPLQYCKVISLQLIKINEKKKNEIMPFEATWTQRLSY